jgi:hypothetical protein
VVCHMIVEVVIVEVLSDEVGGMSGLGLGFRV